MTTLKKCLKTTDMDLINFPQNDKRKMEFHKKYRHVGISYPGVPKGWVPIFERAIVAIEKEMWPGWMSFHLKHLIHWLATGNSVVCIKFRWAERLRIFVHTAR